MLIALLLTIAATTSTSNAVSDNNKDFPYDGASFFGGIMTEYHLPTGGVDPREHKTCSTYMVPRGLIVHLRRAEGCGRILSTLDTLQGSRVRAGAVVETLESPYYDHPYKEREKNAAPNAERIRKATFQYLGDGIVIFHVDVFHVEDGRPLSFGSFMEMWVYIPGKGERELQDLLEDEAKDILRRQRESIKMLERIISPPPPKVLSA